MKSIKLLLNALAISICLMASCRADEDAFTRAYRKSVAWLWSQQSEDGAWHSKTHNVLEDGTVLTPYILYYLLQVPDSIYKADDKKIKKSIAFLEKVIDKHFPGNYEHDSVFTNYPNYSAAYLCRVFNHINQFGKTRKVTEYLVKQQFIKHRGVPEESQAYGGWGYGEPDLPVGEFGHVDLSHTRRITEALLEQELAEKDMYANYFKGDLPESLFHNTNWKDGIYIFLRRAQRSPHDPRIPLALSGILPALYDGGFVSSMYTTSTNKSQPILTKDSVLYYPSYATATCDGLLALHALGLQESANYRDAVKWLTEHQRIDVIDGLSPDDPEQWYQIMHYYHWAVRAEAMTAANIDGPWWQDLVNALIKEQQPDGFYINPIGGVNKEDDPLMATIFCVQAFTVLCP